MSEKRTRETDGYSDDEGQYRLRGRRVPVVRSLGMSDDEWGARERRRARFLSRDTKESDDNKPEVVQGEREIITGTRNPESSQQLPAGLAESQERKPWESLVIGNLGENLSHIERKDREIEQQRFIVQFHQENSPLEVDHNLRILNQLIQERDGMEDNEENNMPQDQREKNERISRRLELLRWVLDNSESIQGYESGQILYSHEFTLLYAGHIVDKSERLDRYFARHGPGWLWQEPPLAGPGNDVLGMKGTCLNRESLMDKYHIGVYQAILEFRAHRRRVSRGRSHRHSRTEGDQNTNQKQDVDASCRLGTLLDSGATFPIILESDLARLNINISKYPAQGVMDVSVVGGKSKLKFYEMDVSIRGEDGSSLVAQGDEAVWPKERRDLGGFCPVLAQEDPPGNNPNFINRLSGMIPFDACYMSSGPSMGRMWLGEDRRDVLGINRLPAHLRFDTDKSFVFEYPDEFELLRQAARTPDRILFMHEFPGNPDLILIDSDTSGRGRSEIAIGKYNSVDGGTEKQPRQQVEPYRIIKVEPRLGGITTVPKESRRLWRKDFTRIGMETGRHARQVR
ncbi:hypothetical protein F4678DRAFT_468923 [Xylaria arbuscula]|nr:hypothetical protein F4678DRAFT_468923 [Xylaria arbuscula]